MIGNKEITQFQLLFVLIHCQIGVGIITLPNEIFLKAKGDSWMSVLLAGIIIQITIFIFGALMKRFPSSNLYGIIQFLFGKGFGKMIVILYSIYFMILGGFFLAKFAVILRAWMMPTTPKWLLVGLIVMIAVYIVKENLQIMARFLFISSITLIGFIGFSIYSLKEANFTYILPIGNTGVVPIMKGIPTTLFSYQGFEFLLLIYPFVQSDQKGLVKVATITNIIVTLFYTFIVMISLLFFSPNELKIVPEPMLYLVKAFTFKIIERPDLLFTSMWIVLVATTIIIVLYASSLGLSFVMNSNKRSIYVFIVAGISFFLAMSVYGVYEIDSVSRIFNPFIILFAIGFPILLLLIAIIFNKKEVENSG
ncbi:GerAB/ArcD/ProY family transporter [Pseudogracilibacillus sp. SO30301A]|uniref:GerAB/ArcD/ProY family transporter n=1 Tax=Pseudogracilibacillus sp. SO30301A TaxID=3098291 RepID=UPI00300DCBCF